MKFTEPDGYTFVAYTTPQRMEGPDGEAITAGTQTLVTYYKGIKVSDIQSGGYHATKGKRTVNPDEVKTVRVEFDPESIGLSHTIAANIAPSDPGLKVLEDALENDKTVNIAIESYRIMKDRETHNPISPLTPIYALMGASTPGGKADMGSSGRTTSKVIAAVNGETTMDCRSDASQWAQLSNNKTGNLPPEGFRLLTDKDDWTKIGVIVPTDTQKSSGGNTNVDMDSLAAAVAQIVIGHLEEQLHVENRRYLPAAKQGEICEVKPFDMTTMHGYTSLGSYLSGRYRYGFEWGHEYLNKVRESKPSDEEVIELVDALYDIASRAQVEAYGGNVKPEPKSASHTEAYRWAQWAIENRFAFTEVTDEWKNEVAHYVAQMMREFGIRVSRNVLGRETIEPTPKASQSGQPRNENSSNTPAPNQDDRMKRLNDCLAAVNKNWNDADKLREIFKYADKLGLTGAPVSVTDDGVVFDRSSQRNLRDTIIAQGRSLTSAVETKPEPNPKPVQDDEPMDTGSHEDTGSVVHEIPVEDEDVDTAPEDDVLGEDDFADYVGGATEDINWGEKLSDVVSEEQAEALWTKAQSSLNETIEFRDESMRLSDAFSVIREEMNQAQELAEKLSSTKTIASLNAIRTEAKSSELLNYLVEDGVSDEPLSLMKAISDRRSAIQSEKKKSSE